MKLRERIQKDRQMLSQLPKEEKLLFIWDYYKLPIIAVGCCLVIAILSLVMGAGKRDIAMYAVFVNAASEQAPDPALLEDTLARAGVDMEGRRIDVDAGLTLGIEPGSDGETLQVLAALFGISGLDVFAADEAAFRRYSDQDAFLDLSLFLEPELLGSGFRYENSEGRTVTGGLILESDSLLHQAGYYTGRVIIGIAANAENLDQAVAFLKQLAQDSFS